MIEKSQPKKEEESLECLSSNPKVKIFQEGDCGQQSQISER